MELFLILFVMNIFFNNKLLTTKTKSYEFIKKQSAINRQGRTRPSH